MNSEAKVGLLFFVGLGLILWFTLFVSKVGGGSGGYVIAFPKVTGLDAGASVTYNGIPVGRVQDIRPTLVGGEPQVEVVFNIEEDFADKLLIGDTTLFAISQGMLGGATLTIDHRGPGTPISNDILTTHLGKEPVTFNQALEELGDLIKENRQPLHEAIAEMPQAVENIGGMAGQIRDTVAENRQHLSQAITGLRDMSNTITATVSENRTDLNEAVRRIDEMATEIRDLVAENRPGIRRTVDQLPQTAANISGAAKEIRGMIQENRRFLNEVMESLAVFAPRLERIGDDVAAITSQIRSGHGTLGRLVFQDTMHSKAEQVLDSAGQRLEEVEPFTSGLSELKFYTGLTGGMNVDTGASSGTAYLRIEPRPWKFYEIGAGYRGAPDDRDTLDEDPDDFNIDLHLAFGWRFFRDDDNQLYRLSVKGGLLENQIGGQADVPLWGDRLSGHLLVRGKDNDRDPLARRYEEGDTMVRAWLEYRVWRRVALIAGGDDLVDDAGPWIGLRGELLDNDIRNFITASSVAP